MTNVFFFPPNISIEFLAWQKRTKNNLSGDVCSTCKDTLDLSTEGKTVEISVVKTKRLGYEWRGRAAERFVSTGACDKGLSDTLYPLLPPVTRGFVMKRCNLCDMERSLFHGGVG